MKTIRDYLKTRTGFTLVELMVVVVVLGILSGIAVQRMADVRDRAEKTAEEANARLLLGSANLAKVLNYVDRDSSTFPYVIRWARPTESKAVNHWYGPSDGSYAWFPTATDDSIYDNDSNFNEASPAVPPTGEWNLNTYLESFPVGYAVEIVFGSDDEGFSPGDGDNATGLAGAIGDYSEDIIRVFRYMGGTPISDPDHWREIEY